MDRLTGTDDREVGAGDDLAAVSRTAISLVQWGGVGAGPFLGLLPVSAGDGAGRHVGPVRQPTVDCEKEGDMNEASVGFHVQ